MVSFFTEQTLKLYIISYDSLTIYDGGSIISPILGNPHCGDSLPPGQISSSNNLLIHFYSDHHLIGPGFKLEYNVTSKKNIRIKYIYIHKQIVKNIFIRYIFEGHSPCQYHPFSDCTYNRYRKL